MTLRSRFLRGVVVGVVAVYAARFAVNRTPVADWIVSPLLIADTGATADAIVVPGAGVVGDCVPNLNGVRRVVRAVRLWRERRAPVLLIAGGSGQADCPVALAMQRFAEDLGVPRAQVRVETASRSTHENASFSAPVLRGWGARTLIVVTDRLHMRRAAGSLRREGFEVSGASVPIYEGHPDNVSMLLAGLREYVALAYYRARGWTSVATSSDIRSSAAASVTRGSLAAGGPRAVEEGQGMSKSGRPLVLLGASYAQGWDLREVGGASVVNKGVAGQQAADLLERFDRDVVAIAPRAVLIWGFINDISRAPAGEMEASLARVRQSYLTMLDTARRHDIDVILASEVTMRPPAGFLNTVVGWIGAVRGKTSYQDQVNTHVLATNRWLEQLAAERRMPLLDFQGVLSEAGGRRRVPFAQPDGSHITTAGYDMLTSYAVPVLERLLGDN